MSTAKPPTLREEQKRFTRQRLIDAALEVFQETGYAAATIEDITTAAGASRATFYLHFKSKAEIVKAVFAEELRPHSDRIYEDLHELKNPSWQEVRDFVASTMEYWDEHRAAIDVLKQAHAVEREEIAETWTNELTGTSDVLAHYLEHVQGVAAADAHVRAIILIGLLDNADFYRRLPGLELPHGRMLDALADLWLTAFQPGRAAPPR